MTNRRKPDAERKSEQIVVRVTLAERVLVEDLAAAHDMTLSQVWRYLLFLGLDAESESKVASK